MPPAPLSLSPPPLSVWWHLQAEERHGSIEERMRHLEGQLEEKHQELLRVSHPQGTILTC